MSIDIPKSIARLLYNQTTVGIPGLGNIISTYRSASIDRVQGLLHPPAKNLRFEANDQVSDEQLLRYLQKEYQISLEEARLVVDQFVSQIKMALERREIFLIPEVGRIYKDYEHQYQFLQDSTNFNLDVFGLPTIQFYPILRSKDSIFHEANPPKVKDQRSPLKKMTDKVPNLRQVPAAMAIGIVIMAGLVTVLNYGLKQKFSSDTQVLPVAEKRLNKKPDEDRASLFDTRSVPEDQAAAVLPEVEEDSDIAIVKDQTPQIEEESVTPGGSRFKTEVAPEPVETEESTYLPDQKSCVLIIGAFSRKKGAEKRIQQIYELGFDAYKDEKNGLNRVGVQFAYETKADIRRVMKKLNERFDVNPWILKK